MTELHTKIIELRNLGYSYNQIVKELNCSKGTVAYYLGNGQKEKTKIRMRKFRKKAHPYLLKVQCFLSAKKNSYNSKGTDTSRKLIQSKIYTFFQKQYSMVNFNVEDVIKKFGENPKCYITGVDIDIYQPRTYQFDHIIPVSKGGVNTLENLGISTKQANMCKHDLTYEQFVDFCKQVVDYYNQKAS